MTTATTTMVSMTMEMVSMMTPSKMTKVNLQVWLQCRMGLCSATNAGAGGNILRCLTTIMTTMMMTMMLTTRRMTTTMMLTTRTKNDAPGAS